MNEWTGGLSDAVKVVRVDGDELTKLEEEYPEWSFGTHWVDRNSGPDRVVYWAYRFGVFLSAFSADSLRKRLNEEGA